MVLWRVGLSCGAAWSQAFYWSTRPPKRITGWALSCLVHASWLRDLPRRTASASNSTTRWINPSGPSRSDMLMTAYWHFGKLIWKRVISKETFYILLWSYFCLPLPVLLLQYFSHCSLFISFAACLSKWVKNGQLMQTLPPRLEMCHFIAS